MTKSEVTLDLSELPDRSLSWLQDQFMFLPKLTLASPALVSIARQIGWLALGETRRRRGGEAPAAGQVDLAQAVELTPGERRVILRWLKQHAGRWPWRNRAFRASLVTLEDVLAESEQ